MSKIKNDFIDSLKLIANPTVYSKDVQNAIDNGFVDNAVKIGDITYLTFAFEKTGRLWYNRYDNLKDKLHLLEPHHVYFMIYGALAIDPYNYILKGYIRVKHYHREGEINLRPQIINKNDKIKFSTLFSKHGFNIIPLLEWNTSNVYAKYIKSADKIYANGYDIGLTNKELYDADFPLITFGYSLNNEDAITIDYVEENLHIDELNKKLATYVSIGNKIANSIDHVASSVNDHAKTMANVIKNKSFSTNVEVKNITYECDNIHEL